MRTTTIAALPAPSPLRWSFPCAFAALACGAGSEVPARDDPSAGAADPAGPPIDDVDPVDPAAFAAPDRAGPWPIAERDERWTRAADHDGAPRELPARVWFPADGDRPAAAGRPFPLVVFSHGGGSTPEQYRYLVEHLATHGFVVAGPLHAGDSILDCDGCAQRLHERPGDAVAVRERLRAAAAAPDGFWSGAIDPTRCAVAGHSNGGWTALAAALRDSGFAAVIAMAAPALGGGDLARMPAPTLAMTAEHDEFRRGTLDNFAALPPPKYLLELAGLGHYAFSDGAHPEAHARIAAVTTAFLRRYLRDDRRYDDALRARDDPSGRLHAVP